MSFSSLDFPGDCCVFNVLRLSVGGKTYAFSGLCVKKYLLYKYNHLSSLTRFFFSTYSKLHSLSDLFKAELYMVLPWLCLAVLYSWLCFNTRVTWGS